MTPPIDIKHPLYGEGRAIDYHAGEVLFAFPGSLNIWEPVSPAEAVLLFHSLPLLNAVLDSRAATQAEIIWRSHRGQISG